jgi:enoyl-CoA hydratase/carnithine racemase
MRSKARGTVTLDRIDGRTTVSWDRPPLNVFDIELLQELAAALRRPAAAGAPGSPSRTT